MKSKDNTITKEKESKSQVVSFSYSAPIPPASELIKYESIEKGLADRIIKMSEKQSEHRQELEKLSLKSQIECVERRDLEAKRGQYIGFFVSIFMTLMGTLIALTHDSWTAQLFGSLFGVSGVGGIVYVFVQGRK